MAVLIQNLGLADAEGPPDTPQYLLSFDPDWTPKTGVRPGVCGLAQWTTDTAKAKRFEDFAEAMAEYRRLSTRYPIRPWDGRPNRPLTAYSVTFTVVE